MRTNNRMIKKQNNLRAKYENKTEKLNELTTWGGRVRKNRRRTKEENTPRFMQNNTKKKVQNSKTTDHDVIHGYWLKKIISIHKRLAIEMNRYLQETDIPKRITKEKTTPIQKDSPKEQLPTITDP